MKAQLLLCTSALALALASCGCRKDETFDGEYAGDAVDSQASSNVKQLSLRLSASGSIVSGTYSLTAVILNSSGALAGTLNGSDLALVLTPGPAVNDCPYRITGVWRPGEIAGTYQAFNCLVRSDGTFTLKKR